MGDQLPELGGAANVERSLQHSWPWPPWVAIALLLGAAALIWWLYRRQQPRGGREARAGLAAIRIALAAVVLLMMHGWSWQRYRTDRPDLLLLLDDSASMLYRDQQPGENADGRPTRWEQLREALLRDDARLLRQLQERYHLKLFRLAAEARAFAEDDIQAALRQIAIDPQRGEYAASRLGDGLAWVLQQQQSRTTAAVVCLTDGITTEGRLLSDAAADSGRRGWPLFAVGVGDDRPQRDVRLGNLLYSRAAFVGDRLRFDVQLDSVGCDGVTIDVQLLENGQVRDEQQVTIVGAAPIDIQLSADAGAAGRHTFQILATPPAEETNPTNNRLTAEVEVRDETIRVLLAQDHPSFDFQFLKTLLERGIRRDRQRQVVELTTVLQDSDPEYAQQDAAAISVFPVTREELYAYDVIVLGDVDPGKLSASQMTHVADFVTNRGGGLILLSGPAHAPLAYRGTPIEPLLPVDLAGVVPPARDALLDRGFQPRLTPLGAAQPHLQLDSDRDRSRRIWEEMPLMYWMVKAPEVRPGTQVLLEHPTETDPRGRPLPLVCSRFVGAGKVLLHLTDESYRWSTHPQGSQYYERYWLQSLRHLCRSQLDKASGAELTSDRPQYEQGQPVRLRARFLDERMAPAEDDAVMVVLQQASRRRQLRMSRFAGQRGVFDGVVDDLPEGQYTGWIASPLLGGDQPPTVTFEVAGPGREDARYQMDADDLRLAAERSGGKYLELAELAELPRLLPPGRQARVEPLPPRPLWNSNLLAALFVALLIAEWLWRRHCGLS